MKKLALLSMIGIQAGQLPISNPALIINRVMLGAPTIKQPGYAQQPKTLEQLVISSDALIDVLKRKFETEKSGSAKELHDARLLFVQYVLDNNLHTDFLRLCIEHNNLFSSIRDALRFLLSYEHTLELKIDECKGLSTLTNGELRRKHRNVQKLTYQIKQSILNAQEDFEKYLLEKNYDALDTILTDEFRSKLINKEQALFMLIEKNNPESLDQLLKRGTNPNIRNAKKQTPLMVAATYGHTECIKHLLAHGADKYAEIKTVDKKNYISTLTPYGSLTIARDVLFSSLVKDKLFFSLDFFSLDLIQPLFSAFSPFLSAFYRKAMSPLFTINTKLDISLDIVQTACSLVEIFCRSRVYKLLSYEVMKKIQTIHDNQQWEQSIEDIKKQIRFLQVIALTIGASRSAYLIYQCHKSLLPRNTHIKKAYHFATKAAQYDPTYDNTIFELLT